MGTLHADRYTLLIISPSFLLIMRNVSEKKGLEKIKTYILCSVTFLFFENPAVCEINVVKCRTGHK
jgi:hypothetical protein